MLSYAFQVLKQNTYESVRAEEFDKIQDLFAAILAKGVSRQLKQGLYREYIVNQEVLSVMRGKLDMPQTMRQKIKHTQKLACEFDELSEDNVFNQILKTTMYLLIKDSGVSQKQKTALKKLLVFFGGVSILQPSQIQWKRLQYQKNNKSYEMLLNICYFVIDGMLQTTEQGAYKMAMFSEEHMARLYEKFILEYYRQHHGYLDEVRAAQIRWDLQEDASNQMIQFLPVMQSDVFLRQDEKVLIIDAKYYGKTMQSNYHKHTLHSGNLYQIFTYVKNQDKDNTGNVAGLLLYAKTGEEITPNGWVNMGGNPIGAMTLDLNQEFQGIAGQLDGIVEECFSIGKMI